MMLAGVFIAILISMGMVLLRAFLGSSVFDRMLSLNSFGTHVIILIVLFGLFKETAFFIDIAIIYGLISFVTSIAFMMYFKYKPEE
jgi:multicomponent Na+:H+ antiporter subunit F